jgi:hypothetical protein
VAKPARGNIQTTTRDSFWRRRWENIEPAVGALIEDGVLLVLFVVVLTVVYLALGMLAALGYDPRRIEVFETVHYYAYLVVLGLFMLDLIIRILLHTARKRS